MNYKNFFTKLEQNLDALERSDQAQVTLEAILERLVEDLSADLGIKAARIYERDDDAFVLRREYPHDEAHTGFSIPVHYAPLQVLLRQGFVVCEVGDPGFDRRLEATLGVRVFAAIVVGEAPQRIVSFSLLDSSDRDHVIYSLNTIRHVVNLKLRKEHLEDRIAEARSIQLSLLPSSVPRFGDYDVAGRTVPAEDVGGDLYDFIEVSSRSLGLAIADAAGHGLPAALQARDAIIGLRMSVEERWRITATIEKLNKIIGRSALVSRFITLFYCEVEPNGTLVYCNAGHTRPLLYDGEIFEELSRGGLVLGPNPDATYERGHAMMQPGSVLLAYTDGISEACSPNGEMFGVERLREIVRERRWTSAGDLVEAVFAAVQDFSGVAPPVDDQTVLVALRRQGEGQ